LLGFSATNKFLLCDSNQQISTIAASNVSPYGDIVKFGNAAYFEGTSTSGGLYALYRIGETITNCTPDLVSNIYNNYNSTCIQIPQPALCARNYTVPRQAHGAVQHHWANRVHPNPQ
jgi:hypothetical protein